MHSSISKMCLVPSEAEMEERDPENNPRQVDIFGFTIDSSTNRDHSGEMCDPHSYFEQL